MVLDIVTQETPWDGLECVLYYVNVGIRSAHRGLIGIGMSLGSWVSHGSIGWETSYTF